MSSMREADVDASMLSSTSGRKGASWAVRSGQYEAGGSSREERRLRQPTWAGSERLAEQAQAAERCCCTVCLQVRGYEQQYHAGGTEEEGRAACGLRASRRINRPQHSRRRARVIVRTVLPRNSHLTYQGAISRRDGSCRAA